MDYYYQIVEYVTGTGSNLLPLIFAAIAGGMGKMWHTIVQERKCAREHELAMKQELKKFEGEKQERELAFQQALKQFEKEKVERDDQYRKEMLKVLNDNTAAIAGNKQVVENFLTQLEKHGSDSRETTQRIHDRIDDLRGFVAEMKASLAGDIVAESKKVTEAEVGRLIKLTEGEISRLIKRLDDITANTARIAAK